jgi:hypothetical protein
VGARQPRSPATTDYLASRLPKSSTDPGVQAAESLRERNRPVGCLYICHDSNSGWPSFTKPIATTKVVEREYSSHGMIRTEARSLHGSSPLGHVFNDGPPNKGGLRYCINSASVRFTSTTWRTQATANTSLFTSDTNTDTDDK